MPLRNRNYRLLWLANLIASFSGHVAMIAFPLVAIKHLGATDWEMGLLIGVEVLPFLLFSLPAGTWVDRFEGKGLLQACFAALAAVTVIVPASHALGMLSMGVLYFAGFLMGSIISVQGTVAQVFTTELVGRKDMVDANAWLMGAESGLKLIGPAAGGMLVQAFGAPATLWVECVLISAACVMLTPIRVTHKRERAVAQPMVPMIREGLAAVWASPVLRSAAALMVCWQFLWHGVYALLVLHATRDLGLSPAQLGIATAMGAVGILGGTVLAKRIELNLGLGTGTLLGFIAASIGWGLMAASVWVPKEYAMFAFGAAYAVMDFGLCIGFVCYTSLRQAVTSDELLGRVVATMRWLSLLLAPLGSVAFGALSHAAQTRYAISGTALALGLAAAISIALCLVARGSALARVKSAHAPELSHVAVEAFAESRIAEQL